jgi:hypothetical protein
VRYQPTLARIPTEVNLRRARKQLQDIRDRIANGIFRFAEEFPDFRDINHVEGGGRGLIARKPTVERVQAKQNRGETLHQSVGIGPKCRILSASFGGNSSGVRS